jgi:hypothetical protein
MGCVPIFKEKDYEMAKTSFIIKVKERGNKAMERYLPITLGLMILLWMPSLSSGGEVYKWVDQKGTVHLTDDPTNIPENYEDQIKIITVPDKYAEPTLPPEKIAFPPVTEPERPKTKPEEPPSGFIPFSKFKYLTEGMTEAEVLMRVGQPTQIVGDQVITRARVGRSGLFKRESLVKKYYYIGDANLGERTTIVTISNGRVQRIERIFPPTW